jgi:hypothetical protein
MEPPSSEMPAVPTTSARTPPEDADSSVELERLKLADHHFLHDLQQFWQRARFFVLLQGALFSVFASIADDDESGQELAPLLVAFGLEVALYWGWISRVTADRIETWRQLVIKVDEGLGGRHIFREAEGHAQSWRHNPTLLAGALPWAIAVMWVIVGLVRYI